MPPKKAAWTKIASVHNEPATRGASAAQGPSSPKKPAKETAAPPGTNYAEIQENEVEALKSIYMDDYDEMTAKPGAWNKTAEISFNLHLKAPSDADVTVTLAVEFPATYPKSLPLLRLIGLDNLRQKTKDDLLALITTKPKSLLGEEMIFEIASTAQDLLEDAAQARAQAAENAMSSLEEERMVREAAASQVAKEHMEEVLRRKEAETAEEERALGQLVDQEVKRRSERARLARRKSSARGPQNVEDKDVDLSDAVAFDQSIMLKDDRGRSASFRVVSGKTLMSKRPINGTYTVRPVVADLSVNLPLLVLKEIILNPGDPQEGAFRQKLRQIEDKLEALKKLRHSNIVELLGFKILRSMENPEDSPSWSIITLSEYANKGSLSEFLDIVESVGVTNVRGWMIQLLEALDFFHRHGIVHEDVQCGNVMLFRPTSGSTYVKLSCGFQRSLPVSTSVVGIMSLTSPSWLAPELAQDESRRTTKTDVWDLGIVFLQMAFGKDILKRFTTPLSLLSTQDFSDSLETMTRQLFRVNPKKRPNPFDLLPSEFLRDDSPLLVGSSASNSLLHANISRTRHDSTNLLGSLSRYANDFVEAGRLGRGGYGEVVKARNKLDGRVYAVKKIPLKTTTTEALPEIMLLSQLNHPNVVRYFTAWLEQDYSVLQDGSEEAMTSADEVSTAAGTDNAEFGYSTGGLDFISSSGYPKVEFGYDTDEEYDREDEKYSSPVDNVEGNGESDQSPRQTRKYPDARPLRSTLYIQMEYCEKHTLRDLIRNKLFENTDEIWRLFRQILDGLCHIHSHHIIHRDLKPDNIFIDVGNNPRIGDFGLAATGQFSTAVRTSSMLDTGDNLTRSIGTTFYVAPELQSAAVGQYNEKVDMYSLGIIFLEMCFPLRTAMERSDVLHAIRNKEHELPDAFLAADKILQGEIIMSLLHHKPSERPSSAELLQSGKLPMQVEDEMFRKALLEISDSDSPQYQKILSAIFSQPSKKVQEFVWDRRTATPADATEVVLSNMVREKLTSIFRRHGGVESKRQHLFPRSEHYPATAVRLLDPTGTILQLPYDFTLPNARAIVRGDHTADKSFCYGTVYRELPQGGEPAQHGEVDFDIVSRNALDHDLRDAEIIKILDEISLEFPPLRSAQMCFHLNHSDLLEVVMDYCRIDTPQRPIVEEVISTLNIGHLTWHKVRSKLRSPLISVASTSLDDLARFDFRDTIDKTHQKLRSIMEGTPFLDRLGPIFNHLHTVTAYLKRLKVRRKVFINPLSSYNKKFYKGNILFQCLYDTKRRDVFAAGGRYDSLIRDVQPKTSSTRSPAYAVGFNLKFDSLCASMASYAKPSGKEFLRHGEAEAQCAWKARRCDVLVGSFDASTLRTTCIEILQELWVNDISAEVAVDASSLEEMLSGNKDDGYSWIINARYDPSAMAERSLKVRSLVKDEEFDVRPSELIGWLKVEIRDRSRRDGSDNTKLTKFQSRQDGTVFPEDKEVEVRVLSAQHRGKKQNRRNVIENAQLRSQELVRTFLDGPIAAIETKDDILEAIRDTRLSDPDSWRKMINHAPAAERQYLGQVHDLLLDMAKAATEGPRNAFIFNFRTGSCIYYDLGRQALV